MPPPSLDPDHWLHRLSPEDWLRAAVGEYETAIAALTDKRYRQGVASARRAAGMALNAVLWIAPNDAWGRSYMAHLVALKADETAPEPVREAARTLVEASLDAPKLVQLGPGDTAAAKASVAILEWCAEQVEAAATA